MNDPAWQAITPEIVCPESHAPAVALNSVGFNVARASWPGAGRRWSLLCGLGISIPAECGIVFRRDLFSSIAGSGPTLEHVENGRVRDAIVAGFRYVRAAPVVQCVLIRTGAFSLAASSLPALLPFLARPHGATGYGLLLGSFGLGALAGSGASAALAHSAFGGRTGNVRHPDLRGYDVRSRPRRNIFFALSGIVCKRNGVDWNPGLPEHCGTNDVSAIFAGAGFVGVSAGAAGRHGAGSTAWGALATRIGVPAALLCSAVALVGGLFTVRRHRLVVDQLELTPSVVRD